MEKISVHHGGLFLNESEYAERFEKKFNYLNRELDSIDLNSKLKEILMNYFEYSNRVNTSTAQSAYTIHLLRSVKQEIQEDKKEPLEMRLFYTFVLYGFNHSSIIEYYLREIKEYLDQDPATEAASILKLLAITQTPHVYRYTMDHKPLGKILTGFLKKRLQLLQLDPSGLLHQNQKPGFIYINHPPRIFMLLVRLLLDSGIVKRTRSSKDLFRFLSDILRGPDKQAYEPNTLSNGFLYNDTEALDEVDALLDDLKEQYRKAKTKIQDKLAHKRK